MIKRLTLIAICIMLSTGFVFAQFNEREIMSQQAAQMLSFRQYSEAEQLFKQLLSKYPDDLNSVLQLIQIYIQTSQVSKADEILEKYRPNINPDIYSEQRIYIYILQGEQSKAMQLAKSYLNQVNHDQNKYRQIASYFSSRGFYEQELELYQNARTHYKDNDLFGIEIANTAMNYRLYQRAITEYLRYLEQNAQNSYYVSNQCRLILKEDSTMVDVIASYSQKSQNPAIRELYASSLASLKRNREALEIYKTLPIDKFQRFADEQFAAFNDWVAFSAYEQLLLLYTDIIQKNILTYRMALIRYRNNLLPETRLLLQQIIDDPQIQERNLRNRSTVNVDARKLMANLALTTDDVASAVQWLNQAKTFARIQSESTAIDIELSRLQLMQENYTAAAAILNGISDPALLPTRDYYIFLSALMQNQVEAADSLMNNYIIQYPASPFVNDSIYLMMLNYDLQDNERVLFFQAFRKRQLQQVESIDILLQLFAVKADEELRIMAAEWAITMAQPQKALDILSYVWTDELIKDYAEVLKLKLSKDVEYEQRLAREFLKQNPNSIFSPNFRQLLNRSSSAKPNL